MKYYTESISAALAGKLKEKGMPIETEGDNIWCPSYAEVFDWLIEQGIDAEVSLSMIADRRYEGKRRIYMWVVGSLDNINYAAGDSEDMYWHEAANEAIEKALELI